MNKEIILDKGDRILTLNIKAANNQQYTVGIEILQHEFGLDSDDVQISVHKLKNSEDGSKTGRSCPGPNQILYQEKPIGTKRGRYSNINASVWYEFHKVGDLPAVLSDE